MKPALTSAFITGYERMAAWADLLDEINVYPVADADTGRNLRISLSPLKAPQNSNTARNLLMKAKGNSGNIAGAFFSKFIEVNTEEELSIKVAAGKEAAWECLQDPKRGTMLTVFDALVEAMVGNGLNIGQIETDKIIEDLRDAVLMTANLLPELRRANVVDAGALGMFLFFEGFFKELSTNRVTLRTPYQLFANHLDVEDNKDDPLTNGYCIDAVLLPKRDMTESTQKAIDIGKHVVALPEGRHLKIHLHADDEAAAKAQFADLGTFVRWDSEKIESRQSFSGGMVNFADTIHIVTDAAGSLSLHEARQSGISLLDSYIILDDHPMPESIVDASELYDAMRRGVRVSTAQASIFERHQCYQQLVHRYQQLAYLCVGSVYTGNYQVASQWCNNNVEHGMAVIDSGAASGRLALIARHLARFVDSGKTMRSVVRFADILSAACDEIVFLDQLKYLAAGGRISKANGFFGDLLNIKPVIRPTAQGAQKIDTVKSREAQVRFAMDYLNQHIRGDVGGEFLLQYTDNADWVMTCVEPLIKSLLPSYRMSVQPMSLTSGAHMGPGTWALAFMPKILNLEADD